LAVSSTWGTKASLLETTLIATCTTGRFATREVNSQGSSLEVLTVISIKSSLSFFVGSELNKGKTLGLAIVLWQLNISDGTVFTEGLGQTVLGGLER